MFAYTKCKRDQDQIENVSCTLTSPVSRPPLTIYPLRIGKEDHAAPQQTGRNEFRSDSVTEVSLTGTNEYIEGVQWLPVRHREIQPLRSRRM